MPDINDKCINERLQLFNPYGTCCGEFFKHKNQNGPNQTTLQTDIHEIGKL